MLYQHGITYLSTVVKQELHDIELTVEHSLGKRTAMLLQRRKDAENNNRKDDKNPKSESIHVATLIGRLMST